jgi:cytochrome c peroxidase
MFINILFLLIILFNTGCGQNSHEANVSQKELSHKEGLGKALFFEKALSANGTKACATCHNPSLAFIDGYRRSTNIYGQDLPHNAPNLLNARYLKGYDWANPNVHIFDKQMLRPMFGQNPK